MSEIQIYGHLLASGSGENQTDLDSSLSPYLTHFIVHPIGRPYFCFAGSWIFGLAIGLATSDMVSMKKEIVTDREYLTIPQVLCDWAS